MALSASQVWEVRTTGSDQNGGAFKAGALGTDYSVQDAAQVAVADAVANGTTTLTSATASFSAAHVGNVLYLTGGSGSLAATRREIVTFTNSTTVVLDATVATGTGITLNLGGALLTFGELASSTRGMVASNKAFVKSGTYTITAGITFAQNVASSAYNTPASQLVGYKTTRGDITFGVNAASRPVIATNTAGLNAFTFSGFGWEVRNLTVGAGTQNPSVGFYFSTVNSAFSGIQNCAVTAYSAHGIYVSSNYVGIQLCEISGGVAATQGIYLGGTNLTAIACYIHDGAGIGINNPNSGVVIGNIVANMSGAANDGIATNSGGQILYNTIYNSGRHGIGITNLLAGIMFLKGNILSKNGGYGITNLAGTGAPARREYDGNAYYNNTSGARNNLDDTTVNPVNNVGTYTNVLDVLLGSPNDPLTNAAGGDFTLNNTVGRGALLRGTGPLNAWPGLTQVGYHDFGAIQHQDAGGTTITTFIEG